MFGINWNDPQTLWLNVTNFGLGLVILVCFAAIGYALLQDVRAKVRKAASERALDHEMNGMLDSHAFHLPELGLTMADGGEPIAKPKTAKKPKSGK